jgi:hypothetical protein
MHPSSPPVFSGVRVTRSLVFCRSLFVLLYFFVWPLCFLFFPYEFWLPIFISSKSSCHITHFFCKVILRMNCNNYILDAMFVVCWIKGSNYNWKHVRHTWEFPWDFLASGGPYYETLRFVVDPTNEWISRDSVLSNQIQDIYMSI